MSVSVVVPTWNRAGLLPRALDSVLQQTFTDFEVIVVDDGSTDDTEAVVRRYGERVRYVRRGNGGVAAARNTGVRHARHELIAFLDSDDWWLPGKLARQVAVMADPDVVLCFTNRTLASRPGSDRFADVGFRPAQPVTVFAEPAVIATWRAGSPIIASASLYRRAAFWRAGGYDERLRVFEDLRLDFRLALSGGRFAAIAEVLAVLDDSPAFPHLSTVDWDFFVRATDACVEIYAEALARAADASREVERNLRAGLAFHLSQQAERLALQRQSARARRRALACLSLLPPFRTALRALAGVIAPGLLAARSRWRGAARG